jgi:NADP-dependent 3-hydroxy acid dehydrogenase YdfG
VDALTKGMRIDLLQHGIKVTAVHPGAVETEFSLVRFKGDKQTADNVYKGFKPLTGKDVAEVVYYVTTLPDHVNINDVIVTPTAQANATYTFKKE